MDTKKQIEEGKVVLGIEFVETNVNKIKLIQEQKQKEGNRNS